jgi:hypothetical protein
MDLINSNFYAGIVRMTVESIEENIWFCVYNIRTFYPSKERLNVK